MSDSSLESYFTRHRRDAVLLHRPYPPHTAPKTNSKFGGLPRLPEHYEWPRDGQGNALHFLAQIDCADIGFATALPERGVLFFFARDDDVMVWNDDDWLTDAAKVIYALDAFAMTPLRAHPDDLGPVGANYPPPAWQGMALKGEDAPKLHVEWPIQPLKIDSWPDTLFEETIEERHNWLQRLREVLSKPPADDWQAQQQRYLAYSEALRARRIDVLAQATGQRINLEPQINEPRRLAQAIFEHAQSGDQAFPFFWINIRHAAQYLLWAFEEGGYHERLRSEQIPIARQWRARADAKADDATPDDADRAAFRDWLMQWHIERPDVQPDPLRYADAVNFAMRANIRIWAGNPALSQKIPAHVYEIMRSSFDASAYGDIAYSQMLGHAPSAQDPLHPDDPTLCLLNLCTDSGLGTMWGDVGNATFYISPSDLAERDFRKVEAEVVGH